MIFKGNLSEQVIRVEALNSENDHFFGGTKVVDKSGKPKILYHGTSEGGFTKIDTNKLSENSLFGKGIYATENPKIASEYSHGNGPNPTVYPFYFSIKNPLRADTPLTIEDACQLAKTFENLWHPERLMFIGKTGTVTEYLLNLAERKEMLENVLKYLNGFMKNDGKFFNNHDFQTLFKTVGYDGIVYTGGGRVVGKGGKLAPPHQVWVAFDPDQVRSVYDKRSQK